MAIGVEVGLRLADLPTLARWLGLSIATTPISADSREPAELPREAGEAILAARRVFRHWPGRGHCLREALVLGHLLRRHRPALRLGVARERGSITAHAWLELAGRSIGRRPDAETNPDYLPLRRLSPRVS
jgi:hypothetical protein